MWGRREGEPRLGPLCCPRARLTRARSFLIKRSGSRQRASVLGNNRYTKHTDCGPFNNQLHRIS